MTIRFSALLLLATLVTLGQPAPAGAQPVGDVFRRMSPSVVVIRSRGRDVSASGQVRFGEIGSGVLISPDGTVMPAAHVVYAMDEIVVEFIGGESVRARVVASEPAADLSLIQLERVPDSSEARPPLTGDTKGRAARVRSPGLPLPCHATCATAPGA